MRQYFSRMSFWWQSKPKSIRYVVTGFAFMLFTVMVTQITMKAFVAIFAAVIGLCGLVLFMMGVIYGVSDL